MSDDLVAFLRARLDEDREIATDASTEAWSKSEAPSIFVMGPDGLVAETAAFTDARHIARHDPARVLAEVDAKRRIIGEHRGSGVTCPRCSLGAEDGQVVYWRDPCATLRLLALPYADHPDYRPEWAPEA